jgi:hypothetical protein
MVKWPGAEGLDEFDIRVDSRCNAGRGMGHLPGLIGGYERGRPLYKSDEITKRLPVILNEQLMKTMPTQIEMLSELTDEVEAAAELYDKAVKAFKSNVKNDIASFKSSADAIEAHTLKMGVAYKNTAAVLTSADFVQAIGNAERLAAALKAIGELQSHKITFAVLDSKPQG